MRTALTLLGIFPKILGIWGQLGIWDFAVQSWDFLIVVNEIN